MSTNKIRCLMIGQRGIGKTTFLEKFPDSIRLNPTSNLETFKFNCINSKQSMKNKSKTTIDRELSKENYEHLVVEVDNYDITSETYLNTNDMGDLKFESESTRIINISDFKVVILAFAMDDSNSFELVRSKWETDLKKNSKYEYILMGLKSDSLSDKKNARKGELGQSIEDIVKDGITPVPESDNKKDSKIKKSNTFAYKKRSCSINSNSSTSRLQLKRSNSFSESEALSSQVFSKKDFKLFAKQIEAGGFIQSTTIESLSMKSIDTYTQFAQNICSIYNNPQFFFSNKSLNSSKSTIRDKLPKSFSAPINYLTKRKTETAKKLEPIEDTNASFVKLDNDIQLNINKQNENPVTVKEKISRLFLGLGTYIVTCGSAKSSKLVIANRLKNMKNSRTTNDLNNHKLVDKNWLLLSSHNSLNSLDEVFTS